MTLTSEIIESALVPFEPVERVYIAYSGGMDSHVLLHLAAASVSLRNKIIAVHVHHGLQPEAEAWAEHCAKASVELGVEFVVLRVNAAPRKGESPEEAARNARYSALKKLPGGKDILLVAHHLEDQLETVFLQMMRGSGLRGLSGMPEWSVFGKGALLRPLLNISKKTVSDYAASQALTFVDDPSNQSNAYDRNFLRNEVLPLLKRRWPGCASTVARAARHCAEADFLIGEMAEEIFSRVCNPADSTLSISRLRAFDSARQQLVIRHWFSVLGLKMPSRRFVIRLLEQLAAANETGHPEMINQGRRFRPYRDRLYCLEPQETEAWEERVWPVGQSAVQVGKQRTLSLRVSSAGIPIELWRRARIRVGFRSGGEKISLPGRKGRRSLKNLYQEAGIPPWERDSTPLIYLDDKLAAVGDKWIGAEFYGEKKDGCFVLSMQNRAENAKDHDEILIVD